MNKKIIIIGGVVASIVVMTCGFFYLRQPDQSNYNPSNKIQTKHGYKPITNESKKYSLEYSDELIAKDNEKTGGVDLFNPKALDADCFECPSEISIVVFDNSGLTLDIWLENENKQYGFMYWDDREKVNINGYEGYKIEMEGSPGSYDYYFGNGNNIYLISTLKEVNFGEALRNIVFD